MDVEVIKKYFEDNPIPDGFRLGCVQIINGKKFVESHLMYIDNQKLNSEPYLYRLREVAKEVKKINHK